MSSIVCGSVSCVGLRALLLSVLGDEALAAPSRESPAAHSSRQPADPATALHAAAKAYAALLSPGALENADVCKDRVQVLKSTIQTGGSGALDFCVQFGISALLVFMQANVSGYLPEVGASPFAPGVGMYEPVFWEQKVTADAQAGQSGRSIDDEWACSQLLVDGEDLYGRVHLPQYLVVALVALAEPLGVRVCGTVHSDAPQSAGMDASKGVTALGACAQDADLQQGMAALNARIPCLSWWAARAVLLQQRCLSHSTLTLQRALVHLWAATHSSLSLPGALTLDAGSTHPTKSSPATGVNAGDSGSTTGHVNASVPPGAAEDTGSGSSGDKLGSAVSVGVNALSGVGGLVGEEGAVSAHAALEAALHMECALTWHEYRRMRDAKVCLDAACTALGVDVSTEGALGMRTQAQEVAKAQLVLNIQRRPASALSAAQSLSSSAAQSASAAESASASAAVGSLTAGPSATSASAAAAAAAPGSEIAAGPSAVSAAASAAAPGSETAAGPSAAGLSAAAAAAPPGSETVAAQGSETAAAAAAPGSETVVLGDVAQDVRPRIAADDKAWEGWVDESEVLQVPRFVDACDVNITYGAGLETEAELDPVTQALILCLCAQEAKASVKDELTHWKLAPYVDAVLRQGRSRFGCQAAAMLLRARHESQRVRVRERALLAFQMLSDSLQAKTVAADKRAVLAFTTPFPTHVALRKELADVWLNAGLVSAAMQVYEALQLWQQLIACYIALGKKAAAEAVIKARLAVDPNNAKLYCAMGDLTADDAWYESAWTVSECKNARWGSNNAKLCCAMGDLAAEHVTHERAWISQRSLGRSALNRKQYTKAAEHFALAVSRSPLHGEAWFSMGFCHLKANDSAAAIAAFTRCVQISPDNGEAWNNIGILHLQACRFRAAHAALGVALKTKPANWQICDNFALAAAKSGEPHAAARATLKTIELSQGQRVHSEVLELLVDEVEALYGLPRRADGDESLEGSGVGASDADPARDAALEYEAASFLENLALLSTRTPALQEVSTPSVAAAASAEDESARVRQRAMLVENVERCVKAAVSVTAPSAAAWRVMARLYTATGDVRRAKEAAIKYCRQIQTPGWQGGAQSAAAVAEALQGLLRLTQTLVEANPDVTASKREAASLRLQISSALKMVQSSLGKDDSTTAALQQALDTVKALEVDLKARAAMDCITET